MKRTFAISLTFFLLSFTCLCHGEEGARVDSFSPQGVVKGVRQVNARFSEPMTTFGDTRNESPFDIACPEKGSARWGDVKNWVYDFDRELPAGVVCSFTLREGVKSLAGNVVGGERLFSFSTGGPQIMSARPGDGRKDLDEEQIFLLTLDAEPDEASVLASVSFIVEGMKEAIGVTIVKGAERDTLLKAAGRTDSGTTIAIRCRQSFPSKALVKLVWSRGVASRSGVATTADQVLTFTVRDRFEIAFSCDRINANAPCIPMLPMGLRFSSPVPAELARKIVMRSGMKIYRPELRGDDEEGDENGKTEGSIQNLRFKGPFPEKKSFVIELPRGMSDDAGRPPANRDSFPLQVSTDGFPPLAKFAAPFGIIELNGDAALPVTLRNVEPRVRARQLKADEQSLQEIGGKALSLGEKPAPIKGKIRKVAADQEGAIIQWLRKVRGARRDRAILKKAGAEEIVIPRPNGENAFDVVGIPLKKAGFHIVEIESPILGAALLDKPRPMYVSTAALVTNMSAHFKKGRESSLVWVTSLDRGEPVADAEVTIRDCKGKLYWRGKSDASGIARIGRELPDHPPYCQESRKNDREDDYYADNEQPMLQGVSGGLFVFARKGEDLTFVHSSWDRGIESWRFNLPYDSFREQSIAHTVFDRTLVRAGETVHMKHFIRNHTMKGFALRKGADLPKAVVVKHRGRGQHYEFPLDWKADNTAETEMTIPKGAELGFYDVWLQKKKTEKAKAKSTTGAHEEGDEEYMHIDGWESGSFRVEEFRVPLMKGSIEPPREPSVNAGSVDVDLYLAHLSGGGAGGAPVRLRMQIRPRSVSYEDFEGYTFANGKVEAGVVKVDSPDRSYDDEEEGNMEAEPQKPAYRTLDFVLDKGGALRATIPDLPRIDSPQTIVAEMEFRDPNGEIQTVSGRVPLWSARLLVGVKPDSWSASADAFSFKAVVLDLKGKAVPGAKVSVELFGRRHYSHRKRLVGGFYSYEHVTETKSVGPICEGTTDAGGLLACSAKSPVSGNVILQATVADNEGNVSAASPDLWLAGQGEWWFDVADSDRIDLLPEKRSYDPGDTARFQVRMPFRSATVLVTVEREGVMEAYVKRISGREPVISVPVRGNYAPNVFVSALCVRGRVGDTRPTALFDPGRPTYRLGIAEIRVGRQAHELKVRVSADHDACKVRGKARIRIRVTRADGGTLPKGAEVALAAVDEGLLEQQLETPRRHDGETRLRGGDRDGPGAGGGAPPLRHEGAAGRWGRGDAFHPRALRHPPLLEGPGQAGRRRRSDPGDPPQRLPHQLFHSRRGQRRERPLRHRQDEHPHDPGADAPFRPPAPRARRGPLQRRLHRAQRLEPGDEPHRYGHAVMVEKRHGLPSANPQAGAGGGKRGGLAGRCAGRHRFGRLGGGGEGGERPRL
jgi:hypothetical protein